MLMGGFLKPSSVCAVLTSVQSVPDCVSRIILENAVETTDFMDAHGYSIKYKLVMIHSAGEGIPVSISL
jgi:hypothetical protein